MGIMRRDIVRACIAAAMIIAVCAGTEEVEKLYIVHMDKSQMPTTFLTHHHWYKSVMLSAMGVERQGEVERKLVYTYDIAMHGFAALLTWAELEAVEALPGYVESHEDRGNVVLHMEEFKEQREWIPPSKGKTRYGRKLQTTRSYHFLGLSEEEGLWPQSEFGDANDIVVGIVDSGIWPESPSFVGDGMGPVPTKWKGTCEPGQDFNVSLCNRKLIGSRYFNKGFLALGKKVDLKKDFNSARDAFRHGTFSASIIAGQGIPNANFSGLGFGLAKGMAPYARLAMYKVAWYDSSSTNNIFISESDIVGAMEQAIVDGVDIISISLSSRPLTTNYTKEPVIFTSLEAVQNGVLVVGAASNTGPKIGTVQNEAPWLLTVGASTIDRAFHGMITLGDGQVVKGTSMYTKEFSTSQNFEIIFGSICLEDSLNSTYIRGNILYCDDSSDVDVYTRVQVAKTAEAIAAIIVYNDAVDLLGGIYSMPVVFIDTDQSQVIADYMGTTDTPVASFQFQITELDHTPAPMLATFSAVGPGPLFPDILKPDLVGPGVNIMGACPNRYRPGACTSISSGTSASTAHVAGIAALLKAVNPDWTPAAIKSAIMTTAEKLDNTGHLIKSANIVAPALTPLEIGCGNVNPQLASNPGLVYDMGYNDYMNYLCLTKRTNGVICQNGKGSRYDLNLPTFTANFLSRTEQGTKQVRVFKRVLTNVGGGGNGVYNAVAYMNPMINVTVTPNMLVFNQINQKLEFALTMELAGPVLVTDKVLDGFLLWSDESDNGGGHQVYSPLVALFPHNY
ncbi:hypothetical protein SUGI_0422970 [Cryptomeria japonica]|nr:hypothetical protein SUGI_0422970 [Cryptomeria japonica]